MLWKIQGVKGTCPEELMSDLLLDLLFTQTIVLVQLTFSLILVHYHLSSTSYLTRTNSLNRMEYLYRGRPLVWKEVSLRADTKR